jgi:hypothetical protein
VGFLVSGSIPAVCRQRYTKFVPGRRTSRDPHLGLNANGQDRVALPAQPETQPVAGHHRHHGPCAGLSGHRWGHGVMLPLGRSSGGTSNENRPPPGWGDRQGHAIRHEPEKMPETNFENSGRSGGVKDSAPRLDRSSGWASP